MSYVLGTHAALQRLGITKVAYGPAEANRVLQVAKAKQLPKAALKGLTGQEGPFFGALPTARNSAADLKKMHDTLSALFGTEGAHEALAVPRIMSNISQTKLPKGAILARGKARDALQQAAATKTPLTPTQHHMLESIVKGHELDEIAAVPQAAFRGYGHMSPDVILKEHNRVTTLPAEYAPVRKVMQEARAPREANALTNYLSYGESPRLSRHAIRRITQQMERDTPKVQERVQRVVSDNPGFSAESLASLQQRLNEAIRY